LAFEKTVEPAAIEMVDDSGLRDRGGIGVAERSCLAPSSPTSGPPVDQPLPKVRSQASPRSWAEHAAMARRWRNDGSPTVRISGFALKSALVMADMNG
jgi:hypothetical protein